ncbi:MAG TPA: hypothetical protein VLA88_02205 [Candidatus Saccharimonadales bacterium]|nr:hypothetical protein [Candidatus Saccharimonadales bacterium]
MNDIQFETRLVAATNRRSDDTNNFVKDTMNKIRVLRAADTAAKPKPTLWQQLTVRPLAQRMALGAVAALMVSVVTFTGYAYAIGSDPISLIKRWIDGDKVKIEYDGRTFEHGKARNYSDAAVTAFAEVNIVTGLSFRAIDGMQIPKNGIEYVGLPPSMNSRDNYENPYLATITATTDSSITIHKVFSWGNKMSPSKDLDETITIPATQFHHFVKGEPATTDGQTGKLVMIFSNKSTRHDIATNKSTPETNYFSFVLTHELAAFKEASYNGTPTKAEEQALYEPSWGGLSNLCFNNGADTCNLDNFAQKGHDGLFVIGNGASKQANSYNPEVSGSYDPETSKSSDAIMRNIMGRIVAMDSTSITVKTSSGAEWKLMYGEADRATFATHFKRPLAVGDSLAGQIIQSIYNLNSRTIPHNSIMSMQR